nr:phage portal protein [Oscillibacter sp.]
MAGIIQDLQPIPSAFVAFIPDGWGYRVIVNGKEYDPDDVLHFTLNPDPLYPWLGTGYRISLADVAQNLKQAAATQKGFMESKWKPSLIVKVDALTEEFSSPEGRRVLVESYIDTARAGEPWMIPAEQFEVEQVKPLTLSDLALDAMVTLDKRTVAAVLGIPASCWAWGLQPGRLEQLHQHDDHAPSPEHGAGADQKTVIFARLVFPVQLLEPVFLLHQRAGERRCGDGGPDGPAAERVARLGQPAAGSGDEPAAGPGELHPCRKTGRPK